MRITDVEFNQGLDHIDSHYSANAGELKQFSRLEHDIHFQNCVIGGGLAGLTCALELARAGQSVAILEANRIGWGASGRNGGFVASGFARSMESIVSAVGLEEAKSLFRLSEMGRCYVWDTISKNNLNHLVGGKGWLKVLRHPKVEVLWRSHEFMSKHFEEQSDMITGEQLPEYVRSKRYHAALFNPQAFHILPLQYASQLALIAHGNGAGLYEKSRCLSVERDNNSTNRQWVARTSQGSITAQNIILASSAYGGPYARLNRALIPVATYVVSSIPIGDKLDEVIPFRGCISDTRRAGDYYRTLGNGNNRRLIWGGRITTRKSQPDRLEKLLKADIAGAYPFLKNSKLEHSWSGLMGYTPSQMPIIGKMENGLWAATAFGGHGLNTSAMAGKLIADAISHGDDRHRLFSRFPPKWAGGIFGQMATQATYWKLQLQDRWDERRSSRDI